jgi:hypothetical protein
MTNLDILMEFLLAGVFLIIGIRKVLGFRRRPRALGARHSALPLGLPYGVVVALGLVEIVAALALITPIGPIPPAGLALFAAISLALVTAAAGIYRARRRQSAVPSVMLFLMALFVIVGHTL